MKPPFKEHIGSECTNTSPNCFLVAYLYFAFAISAKQPPSLCVGIISIAKVCHATLMQPQNSDLLFNSVHTHCNSKRFRPDNFHYGQRETYMALGVYRNSLLITLSEDDMPDVLQDSPTQSILQFRLEYPSPKSDIIFPWPLPYLFAGYRELRTARCCDQRGPLRERPEQVAPHFGRDHGFLSMTIKTSRIPIAAQIDVPHPFDVVKTQVAERVDVVVIAHIRVPGCEEAVTMRMQEDDYGGEGVIVVDQVG